MTSKHARSAPRWFTPLLGLAGQPTVRCILYRESRSTYLHPNVGDTNPYQFGPFQFTTVLWNRWSWVAGVGHKSASWFLGAVALDAVSVPAYRATLLQQSKVFVVVARNDGFGPWVRYDGC